MTDTLTKNFHISDVLSLSTRRALGSPETLIIPNGEGIREGATLLGMVKLCEHLSGVKLFNKHSEYDKEMLSSVKEGTTKVLLAQHGWLHAIKFPDVELPNDIDAVREMCDEFVKLVQVTYSEHCPDGWVEIQSYHSQVADVVNPIRGNQFGSHLHLIK